MPHLSYQRDDSVSGRLGQVNLDRTGVYPPHSESAMSEHEQSNEHHKSVTIYVNGRPRTWTAHRITYSEVTALAFPEDPKDGSILYTVAYANPHGKDGTLAEGGSVVVHEGMTFNVGKTNRS